MKPRRRRGRAGPKGPLPEKSPARNRKAGPSVRLPLPKKSEKRHEDRKKYERAREMQRLRKEME